MDREVFIKETYEYLLSMPRQVFSIFIDYFGEDNVDLQGISSIEKVIEKFPSIPEREFFSERDIESLRSDMISEFLGKIFILIRFGDLKVTNEFDKSVYIQGLWVKVPITTKGKLKSSFSMNRSEYNILHLSNNYMHSHVSSIPSGDFTKFQSPCLGNGPINYTVGSLYAAYDEDTWGLFCFELDKYVHVESVRGHPYHRLENLSRGNNTITDLPLHSNLKTMRTPYTTLIKDFTLHFLTHNTLKFNFYDGAYSIAMNHVDYLILISNNFIEWFNDQYRNRNTQIQFVDLLDRGIIREYTINNGVIYTSSNIEPSEYMRYNGKLICEFKGESIHLKVTDDIGSVQNAVTLLSIQVASKILKDLLKFINFNYGKAS